MTDIPSEDGDTEINDDGEHETHPDQDETEVIKIKKKRKRDITPEIRILYEKLINRRIKIKKVYPTMEEKQCHLWVKLVFGKII